MFPMENTLILRICDEDAILADSKILQKVDILCGISKKTIAYASLMLYSTLILHINL